MAEPVPPSPLPTKPIKFATETRPKTSGTQSEKRAANTPLIAACRGANSSRLYRIRKLMAWASVFALRSEFGMGMRIDSSASTGATQGVAMANWQQKQQSFKDLFSSLQSGNLSSAQAALKSLTGGTVNSSSPLASIAQALQSGDLAGAQKAAQDFQAKRAGHHAGAQSAAAAPVAASYSPGSLSIMA